MYIPCYVISEPIVNISWSKPSGVLPPGRHHVCSNGTLKIYNLTMTDPGIYMCTAVNSWGSTTVSSVLTSEGKILKCVVNDVNVKLRLY